MQFVDATQKQWRTYCELGILDSQNDDRIVHQQIWDDEAYEHFALPLYLKHLLDSRQLMKHSTVSLEDIPRKEKCLFLFEIFRYLDFQGDFLELGSSLFEVIDGLELMNHLHQSHVDLKSHIVYQGIEISDLFRRTALALHPEYTLRHIDSCNEVEHVDILYDRMVSSYCFRTCADFACLMNKAKIGYYNLALSKKETFIVKNDAGKEMTYFSLPELLISLDKPLFYLFGRNLPDRMEAFYLNCSETDFQSLLRLFHKSPYLNQFIRFKDWNPTKVVNLVSI